jgi:hypothetical protein
LNILSNGDILSSLSYVLATSPEPSHAWLVFKLIQWEGLKSSASIDTTLLYLSPFTFPPPLSTTHISKAILEYWNTLDLEEILEWEELARDIRCAYARLVAQFANGTLFDGNIWEAQRHYLARSLFFKWTGYQAVQTASVVNNTALMDAPVSLVETVSSPSQFY